MNEYIDRNTSQGAHRRPSADRVLGGIIFVLLLTFLIVWLFSGVAGAQERYPYCGGTGVAIVGTWPAFSCTQYDDKCNVVVVPCSPAQRALIAFIGGHEVPAGNTAVSTRTPARRTSGGYSPKGAPSR